MNLYAIWSPNTVTFTYIDMSGNYQPRTATFGQGAHVTIGRVLDDQGYWYTSLQNIWTYEGHDIQGFDTSNTKTSNDTLTYYPGGGYRDPSGNWMNYLVATSDMTLYVYWDTIQYYVQFLYEDQNGVEHNFGTQQTVLWGQKLTRPATVPLVYGKTFRNWYQRINYAGVNIISATPFDFDTVFTDDVFSGWRSIYIVAQFDDGGITTGDISTEITFTEIRDPDNIITSGPYVSAGDLQIIAGTFDSYTWYLDNVQMSFNNILFSVPVASLANGQHDITLIVSKVVSGGTRYYSWYGQFNKN